MEVCRERDASGVYAKADAGEITDFPGVSASYEPQSNPDLVVPTHEWPLAKSVEAVMQLLEERAIV